VCFCSFRCSKISNSSKEESKTPFTDICTKYIDSTILYEYGKSGTIVDIMRLSIDEKVERIQNIDYAKNSTKSSFETVEDSIYYYNLYEELIKDINKQSCVIEKMEVVKSRGDINEIDLEKSMTISEGDDILISKMDILKEYEISLNSGSNPNKLAKHTGRAKWPSTIKYRLGKKVNNTMKSRLKSAMSEWKSATNNKIDFSEIKNSGWHQFIWGLGIHYHVYVTIETGEASGSASVGYVPWSTLKLESDPSSSTCLHELGHVLGLIHEHQRKDRDNYVTVYTDNIKSGYKHNFNKETLQKTYGDFDFNSIMIYSSKAFTKHEDLCTMKKKNGDLFYYTYVLSSTDKVKIKEIYD
jgi:hypothetical protein